MIGVVRRVTRAFLASEAVRGAARAFAAARGHRLILVYHRIAPLESNPQDVVIPVVGPELFRAHVQALAEVVDLVSLDALLDQSEAQSRWKTRPAVALTFDDDLPSHTEWALPILTECRLQATFFLSGRALLGLGTYWFQDLETLLTTHGLERAGALLGLTTVDAFQMALACQSSAALRQRVRDLAATLPQERVLDFAGIVALRRGNMTIGFHTAAHESLPESSDAGLEDALHRGRTELEAAASAKIKYFAYPYGRADARAAAAVRRAGFLAAFTGQPSPLRRGVDPYRVGRWEPGALAVPDLLAALAVRLHRTAPVADGASYA